MGLVGLVCFLSGSGIRINGISGIRLLFERKRSRDNAPSFWLWDWFDFSPGMVSRWCACLWIVQRINLTLVFCYMGIPICRALIPQCNCWPCSRVLRNVAPRAYVRLTLGLVLYGHTYLSRSHTTVQCMTMLRGTPKKHHSAHFFTRMVIWPVLANPSVMPFKLQSNALNFIRLTALHHWRSDWTLWSQTDSIQKAD